MSTVLYERGGIRLTRTSLGRGKGTSLVLTTSSSSAQLLRPTEAILFGIALLQWASEELLRRYGDA